MMLKISIQAAVDMAPGLEEHELRMAVMKVDLSLNRKQAFWETPRNLFIIGTVFAGIVAALAGSIGYGLGQSPQQPVQVIYMAPNPATAVSK